MNRIKRQSNIYIFKSFMFIEAARSRVQNSTKISDSIALNNLSPLEISIDFYFIFILFVLFRVREQEREDCNKIYILLFCQKIIRNG